MENNRRVVRECRQQFRCISKPPFQKTGTSICSEVVVGVLSHGWEQQRASRETNRDGIVFTHVQAS